jgi:hypothetical protein
MGRYRDCAQVADGGSDPEHSGFLIYVLQSNHPVPASFMSTRRRRLQEAAAEQTENEQAQAARKEVERLRLDGAIRPGFWLKIPMPTSPAIYRSRF